MLRTIALPGGVSESGVYDMGGRLTHVGATGPATASAPLASGYDYGYSPVGTTSAVTTTLNGAVSVQRYGYDGLGRLTGGDTRRHAAGAAPDRHAAHQRHRPVGLDGRTSLAPRGYAPPEARQALAYPAPIPPREH